MPVRRARAFVEIEPKARAWSDDEGWKNESHSNLADSFCPTFSSDRRRLRRPANSHLRNLRNLRMHL
jgi:hypothetical protein